MHNTIKIGVIGLPAIVELSSFPNFTPIIRVSNRIGDAPVFAAEIMEQVEVLLFSGYYPYKIAKEQVAFTVPAHYIPLTGTGLYRSLFRMYQSGRIGGLSIDLLANQAVEKVFAELDIPAAGMHYYDGVPYRLEDMIQNTCKRTNKEKAPER
ncbi:hypothetical protein [Brevibacillus massiliensis]|jgi:hypothetical protein|uniref:hypothetical protein n=1 Tax=Brevibacillus massiliensis TaxID=1118054 RepID=UPI0002DF2830|nr:hypothetical protein [Brevibacillus massiliensis]